MSEDMQLPLRPLSQGEDSQRPLSSIIAQINAERDSFRDITEESLIAEIEAIENGETVNESHQNQGETDFRARRDAIFAVRESLMKNVLHAQNEALYALDFISLLLSKMSPRQAETSMSPFLKQVTPMGSVGCEKIEMPQETETERSNEEIVSQGWQLDSLNAAADYLLQSAVRLQSEMGLETQYWEQMLSIKESGWPVCRMPREKHTLGVRFGFLEASPEFRNRGLAPLRRALDGKLFLDMEQSSSQCKTIRVRIRKNGTIVGSTKLPERPASSDEPIQNVILQARNSLFEEELFFELNRETRIVLNQGVHTVDGAIVFPFTEGQDILIDLVTSDMDSLDTHIPNDLADAVALVLRLLLSHTHQLNLLQRSEPPPPIEAKHRPTPPYQILRPILTHIKHHSALSTLYSFFNSLTRPFHMAGLTAWDITLSEDLLLSTLNKLTSASDSELGTEYDSYSPLSLSLSSRLLHSIASPQKSTITVTFPSGDAVTIVIRTSLQAPLMCTEFTLQSRTPTLVLARTHFTSLPMLRDYLIHLMTLDLVELLIRRSAERHGGPGKRGVDNVNNVNGNNDMDEDKNKNGDGDVVTWTAVAASEGKIEVIVAQRERGRTVTVEVDEGVFRISWKSVDSRAESQEWSNSDGQEQGDQTAMLQLSDIEELVERRNKDPKSV